MTYHNEKNNGHVDILALVAGENISSGAKTPLRDNVKPEKNKKYIPPQIDDVEQTLLESNRCLYKIENKKDKAGNPVKKKGKEVREHKTYRMGLLRVAINNDGYRLQWKDKNENKENPYGIGITKKEYESFLNTASVKKRLNLFLKYQSWYVIRKIKKDSYMQLRLSEAEQSFAKKLAKKAGISVSELIRKRLRGTIIHEALSSEEKHNIRELLLMATELKQYGTALNNYMKTTQATGAHRLDAIFDSEPGTDYAKVIWRVLKKIDKIIKKSYDN